MSSDDERDLGQRLGSALDTITPAPAPVDMVLRKGRARRTRRHITVAAGLAVAVGVGVGVAVPGLLHQSSAQPALSPARKPTVTVNPVGPGSPPGLIGSGTINGKRWRLVAQAPGAGSAGKGSECFQGSGAGLDSAGCVPIAAPSGASTPADFNSVSGRLAQAQFGAVEPDVSQVTVTLADGTVLVLHPVEAYGLRYVTFAVPLTLAVTRVVAYSGHAELGYAVPFSSRSGDIVTIWLGPGQRGLARGTYKIGSGWVVHRGPWGYCLTGQGGYCLDTESRSLGNSPDLVLSVGPGGADWAVGTATAVVNHVRVHLSGGRILTARAVSCGGPRFYAYVIPKGLKPLRVDYYSVSGHLLASQQADVP